MKHLTRSFALLLALAALVAAPVLAADAPAPEAGNCEPIQSIDAQPTDGEVLDLDQLVEQGFTPQPDTMIITHSHGGCDCAISCSSPGQCFCSAGWCCNDCCWDGYYEHCT